MSLLNSITRTAKAEDDLVLDKGKPAPFRGVLVSPMNYEIFTSDRLEAEDFKNHLDTYVKPVDSAIDISGPNLLLPGLLIGLLGGFVLAHAVSAR